MPRVGFESTNPVFERVKTVHALDSAATVISTIGPYHYINSTQSELHDLVLKDP
jgi:hypothetical protein